jgi:hypothetical protein
MRARAGCECKQTETNANTGLRSGRVGTHFCMPVEHDSAPDNRERAEAVPRASERACIFFCVRQWSSRFGAQRTERESTHCREGTDTHCMSLARFGVQQIGPLSAHSDIKNHIS